MATASSFSIRYLGTGTYSLDLRVSEGQQIRHTFSPGETLDITAIASPSELNRVTSFVELVAAGTFSASYTAGSTDLTSDAAADVVLGSATPAAIGSGAASAGDDTLAARADHVHAITAGSAPPAIAAAASVGAAITPALSDHTHTIGAGIVTSTMASVAEATGASPLIVLTKTFPAGAGGSADDVTIFNANAPYAFQIVDSFAYVTTNVGGSTLTLRSATAGGGSAKSDAFDSATTGIKRNAALTALPSSTAAAGTLVIRRSDSGVAGSVVLLLQKV